MRLTLYSFIGCDPYIQDANLFRHYVKYYKSMGVDKFNLILHSNELTDEHINTFKCILEENEIPVFKSIYGKRYYDVKRGMYRDMMNTEFETHQDGDWFVYADGDEFINTGGIPFKEYLHYQCSGYNCVRGRLRERIAVSHKLESVSFDSGLTEQYPLTLDLKSSMRLGFGTSRKVCFTRYPHYLPSQGHHRPSIRTSEGKIPIPGIKDGFLYVDHYRWTTQLITNYQNRLAHERNKLIGKSKVDMLVKDCIENEGKLPEYVTRRIAK